MTQIIDGKALARSIRQSVKEEVETLFEKTHTRPHLVVVLIGDDPASHSYVKAKEKACAQAGIRSTKITAETTITEAALLARLEELNQDDDVHGILVQLPLPSHIDENKVLLTLDRAKDVDGFHPLNIAALHMNEDGILPATPKGVITMLKSTGIDMKGKKAVVVGRSNIVGKPTAALLLKEHATVTIAHSRTVDLASHTRDADILIAAAGRAKMIDASMIKDGAVVIDVGVNRVDDRLVGDVDYDDVMGKASFLTPVPGGVGPMTIASLLENTLTCFKKIQGIAHD